MGQANAVGPTSIEDSFCLVVVVLKILLLLKITVRAMTHDFLDLSETFISTVQTSAFLVFASQYSNYITSVIM